MLTNRDMNSPSTQPNFRRKRWSLRRKTLLILLFLGLLWGGFEIVWRVTAVPAPVVDYAARLVELTESYQPAGDPNGWDTLMEAIIAYDTGMATALEADIGRKIIREEFDATPEVEFSAMRRGALDLELFPRELIALKQIAAEGVWDLIDEAMASPRVVRPKLGAAPLLGAFFGGELSKFRQIAKARNASMRLAATRGEHDGVVRAFEQTLALGRICSSQSFLIDRLVGMAIYALATGELRTLLGEYEFDETTSQSLLAAMDRQFSRPPLALCLEGERIIFLDQIQNVFTDDGHGDGRFDPARFMMGAGAGVVPPSGSSVFSNLESVYAAGRRETTELTNRMYDRLIEASRLTRVDRLASFGNLDKEIDNISHRHSLLRISLPAIGKTLASEDFTELQLAGTRQLVLLEIHFARHDAWPETLADLDMDLRSPPILDPFTGQPFIYRLLEADEHDRPFLLYSLCEDGEDQSDRWDDNSPSIQMHYAGTAFEFRDYVLNHTRRPLASDE